MVRAMLPVELLELEELRMDDGAQGPRLRKQLGDVGCNDLVGTAARLAEELLQ